MAVIGAPSFSFANSRWSQIQKTYETVMIRVWIYSVDIIANSTSPIRLWRLVNGKLSFR